MPETSDISFISTSPENTRDLARAIAAFCSGGEVFLLDGDLGAGKTCFTQGLGAGLGVGEDITSPTFVLHCQYQGRLELNHIDAYRLEDDTHVEALGFDEFFADNNCVTVIEWPQMLEKILPMGCIHVYISSLSSNEREFKFSASAKPALDFISALGKNSDILKETATKE